MEERRGRSRNPLRLILTALLIGCALWLAELYMQPTWGKIRSFLLGYFLGTFVMEWIRQRAGREAAVVLPAASTVVTDR